MRLRFGPNMTHDYEPVANGTCYIIAAGISAAAGLVGAGLSASAAKSAAQKQAEAGANAIATQKDFFNQSKEFLTPFQQAGTNVLSELNPNNANSTLAALKRLTTPGADQTAALEQTPGFQFANTYGQKAVGNALAARGLGGPGGALAKGAANYATGLASNTWQSVVNALLGTQGANQNVANMGANAANALANAAGQTGQGVSNTTVGIGNVQAAGQLGSAAAISGGLNNAANSGSNYLMLQELLDRGAFGTSTSGGGGGLYGIGTSSSGNDLR